MYEAFTPTKEWPMSDSAPRLPSRQIVDAFLEPLRIVGKPRPEIASMAIPTTECSGYMIVV
jgi:hypothetical protein